ncbi:MAG: AAA family ATPase [Halobacteriaceae archaeon]
MTFRPALVVVCGLPGVGKTTVGRHLAEAVDADLVRTDVVRKDLFPEPEYTQTEERSVYDALLDRAADRLDRRENVVLDGTFYRQPYRDRAAAVADDVDATFRLVYVTCREEVVRDRIADRDGDESDATFEIHQQYRDQFHPVEREHVRVDNDGPVAELRRQVRSVLPTPESAD